MHVYGGLNGYLSLAPQCPRFTPAWDTLGFIANVVTKLCKADPG